MTKHFSKKNSHWVGPKKLKIGETPYSNPIHGKRNPSYHKYYVVASEGDPPGLCLKV
jgi:hypothetical protein